MGCNLAFTFFSWLCTVFKKVLCSSVGPYVLPKNLPNELPLLAVGLDVEVDDLIVLDNPKEEIVKRKWMLLLHASPFFGLIIPFANVLFPLFTWMSKAEDNKIYDEHGRKVVNFHCTINLMLLISLLLFFPFPGMNFFGTGAVFLFGVIFSLKNTMSALGSGICHYPLSIPFLKPKA
jgi:uncharacterized Tic20 family protein